MPKGFPKLTETISSYELNSRIYNPQCKCRYIINWDELQESEASEIAQKIRNWIGYDAIYVELTDEPSGKPRWSFENSEYLIDLYYYDELLGINHWSLNIYSYKEEPQINLKHADPTVAPDSERYIKWEDKEVPDELPKLADYVTGAALYEYNKEYEIYWNGTNFSESEYFVKKIYEAFDDDIKFSFMFDHSKYYYWEFNGTLNGVKKIVFVYYIAEEIEPTINFKPHTDVGVSYP